MEINLINTQKVLSPTQISLADYVINPYRGCEFGCLYCYSQENKNINKDKFFECLDIKINAAQILEKELKYKKPKRILLGSTTECFQYPEIKYKITSQILNLLNNHDIPYTILTKSHLTADYLAIISKNKENKIYFTFNTPSDRIITLLEKKTPNIKQRITAINKIIASKTSLRIHIGPFIPYLSDLETIISLLPKGIREVDIELYHHQMGNFKKILAEIEENIGEKLKNKIAAVYQNKENYQKFSEDLKAKICKIKKKSNVNFYYIVPDFTAFYSPSINYQTPV